MRKFSNYNNILWCIAEQTTKNSFTIVETMFHDRKGVSEEIKDLNGSEETSTSYGQKKSVFKHWCHTSLREKLGKK